MTKLQITTIVLVFGLLVSATMITILVSHVHNTENLQRCKDQDWKSVFPNKLSLSDSEIEIYCGTNPLPGHY
jgi:hypothetical protein